eukprot:CFRG0931T1
MSVQTGEMSETLVDCEGKSMLEAINNRDHGLMTALLDAGTRVDGNGDAASPLYLAASIGDAKAVYILLERGAQIDYRNSSGHTALTIACLMGNEKIAKDLIDAGANVNNRDLATGKTPLHTASTEGNCNLVRLLLKGGADPTICDTTGRSPVDMAKIYRRDDVLQLLPIVASASHEPSMEDFLVALSARVEEVSRNANYDSEENTNGLQPTTECAPHEESMDDILAALNARVEEFSHTTKAESCLCESVGEEAICNCSTAANSDNVGESSIKNVLRQFNARAQEIRGENTRGKLIETVISKPLADETCSKCSATTDTVKVLNMEIKDLKTRNKELESEIEKLRRKGDGKQPKQNIKPPYNLRRGLNYVQHITTTD